MKEPITIKLLDGCNYSLEINGEEFVTLPTKQQKELCHKLIDNENITEYVMQRFIELFMESCADEDDLGYCEQCDSYNDIYKTVLK